jgi:hypothetical protein
MRIHPSRVARNLAGLIGDALAGRISDYTNGEPLHGESGWPRYLTLPLPDRIPNGRFVTSSQVLEAPWPRRCLCRVVSCAFKASQARGWGGSCVSTLRPRRDNAVFRARGVALASLVKDDSSSPQPRLSQRNRNMMQTPYNATDLFSSQTGRLYSCDAAGRVYLVQGKRWAGQVFISFIVSEDSAARCPQTVAGISCP